MLLRGSDGTEFEIKVTGYQFPHLEHEDYDSDLLNIAIRARLAQRVWTTTDPSLPTWEVASLAQWFESIAEGSLPNWKRASWNPTCGSS
jgi:hypothetical protein